MAGKEVWINMSEEKQVRMEWVSIKDRLPKKHGVYPVKIDGFINYCSFSFECWYWLQALNSDNMMHLRRYPLVGMQFIVDEWLDIPDPTNEKR